ncbi:MAG: hypothetical protein OHK0029_29860 [Armatimonadaceae bacterium]
MGFVERFGAAFGYGIARLEVTLEEPNREYAAGDVIHGTISTLGGKLNEKGILSVSLYEHWVEMVPTGATMSSASRYRHHNSTLLVEGLELKAGEKGPDYPFALTMVMHPNLGHDWGVMARFEAPNVAESTAQASFRIHPPAAIAGLVAMVREVLPMEMYQWYNHRNRYHVNFRPETEEVKEQFDALHFTVDLDTEADTLNGELLINPQEHTVSDHLQSLLQSNNRTVPIAFTASEVARGAESDAAESLREILRAPVTETAATE